MLEHWFMLEVLAHELLHPNLRPEDAPPEWRLEGDLRGGCLLYWMIHNYARWDPRFQAQGLGWDHSIPGPVCEGGLSQWLDLPSEVAAMNLLEKSFSSLEAGYGWLKQECRRRERVLGHQALSPNCVRTTVFMPNPIRDEYARRYNRPRAKAAKLT